MEFIDVIIGRKSVRKFNSEKKIDNDVIKEIVRLGSLAPSAGNGQPWKFIAVKDQEKRQKMADRSQYAAFLTKVDTALIILAHITHARDIADERYLKYFPHQDTSAAIENILLAAWDKGIGTCWIGDFSEAQLIELCNIPDEYIPVGIIAMGYPADDWRPANWQMERKPVDEILTFE